MKKQVIKTKLLPLSITAMMASSLVAFTGCSNKDEDTQTTYTIEKTEDQILSDKEYSYLKENTSILEHVNSDLEDTMECTYYIDLNNTALNNAPDASMITKTRLEKFGYEVDSELYEEGFYNKDFVYPVKHINYTNGMDFFKINKTHLSKSEYIAKTLVTIPEEYRYVWDTKSNIETTGGNIRIEISYKELCGTTGYRYLKYDCTLTARDNIKVKGNVPNEYTAKYGKQKGIKEGDYISYKAIFRIDNDKLILLADKQTGIGCKNDNIKETVLNNYDNVFKSIRSFTHEYDDEYYYDLDNFYKDIYKDDVIIRVKK